MKMLIFKPQSRPTRADGTKPKTMTLRERARKFGRVLNEETISNRRDVLICGPHAAGKTRWLDKMHVRCRQVWGHRPVVRLSAIDPLSKWADHPALEKHLAEQGKKLAGLPSYARTDALIDYINTARAVVMLDDTHKLTGRKLAVATRCADAAHIVVSTTTAEQATPITLRLMIDRRNPQRIDLASDAAYDATSIVMWLCMLISLGAGAWQLAAVLGGLKFLAGGRGASKQS